MTDLAERAQSPAINYSTGAAAPTRRRRRQRRTGYWVRFAIAVVIAIPMIFPLYWMISVAFTPNTELINTTFHLWPAHPTMANFDLIFSQYPIWTWFENSAIITVFVTAITVTINLLAGYAFAKLPFRGSNAIFLVLLTTMMIPVQVIMVAQFKLVIHLTLYGTFWAVILPASASAFGVFLARQFFIAIPTELIEAGRVDGAGSLRIFRSLVLPLCRPLIVVLVLLTVMYQWNDFAWPLIALKEPRLFTLPIGLMFLKGQFSTNYGAVMALAMLSILPIVILFVVFQRYFVQGLARSGIK